MNDKSLRESLVRAETNVSEIKKQLKDAEARREEALSRQTQIAIELQSIKLNVMIKLTAIVLITFFIIKV